MIYIVVLLLLVIVSILFERRRRQRLQKRDRFSPEERELYLDTLRRKHSAEMKERKGEWKP